MYQPMNVQFMPHDAGIDFSLSTGPRLDRFRISLEALRDHFGADAAKGEADFLACFDANDQAICTVAFKKTGAVQEDERILISTFDF